MQSSTRRPIVPAPMVADPPTQLHLRWFGSRGHLWHLCNKPARQVFPETGHLRPKRTRQFWRLLSSGKMPVRQGGPTGESRVVPYRRRANFQQPLGSNRLREPFFRSNLIDFFQPDHNRIAAYSVPRFFASLLGLSPEI
jgi:hypothetical protein